MTLFSYLKKKAAPAADDGLLAQMGRAGPHESRISELFDGRVRFEGATPEFPRRLIILAFTNRSGSNLMAEYMRQAGHVAGVGEFLNHDIVARHAAEKGITSFPDYIRELHDRLCGGVPQDADGTGEGTHGPALGLKASWDQMAMLLRWNIIGMFPDITVIHVIRHYVVAQSVSYGIALQTQAWTSKHPSLGTRPDLSTLDVARSAVDFHRANLIIRLLSESFALQRLDIGYEQIVNTPQASVPRVLRAAQLAGPDWTPRPPGLAKQADGLNEALIEGFYETVRKTVTN